MYNNLTYKKLFLIDGIGAIVTALLLSQVLGRFEPFFGMPKPTLLILAAIAGCFAVYSLSCYWLVRKNESSFLLVIAIANTLYCILTAGLVFSLSNHLTFFGIAYFIGEIIVVMSLVGIELQFVNRKK